MVCAIKLCGRLKIVLRGLKLSLLIGHAPTLAGVGNFVDIIN